MAIVVRWKLSDFDEVVISQMFIRLKDDSFWSPQVSWLSCCWKSKCFVWKCVVKFVFMCIQWISWTCVEEVVFWNEFHKVCHGFTGFVKQYWIGRNRISIYPRLSFPHSCVVYCVGFSILYLIRPDFTISEISISNLPPFSFLPIK